MKPDKVHATLDARGLLCPMPVVKATKAIQPLAPGQILEILATDKGSCIDIPAWCESRQHQLLHADQVDHVYRYYVRKGS